MKPMCSNYYDDRVLDMLDTDVRYVWSGFTDLGGARMDSDCKDAWGVTWRRSGPHITSVDPPLKGAALEDVEAFGWPDPEKYLDFELMEERIRFLKRQYPDKAIGARAVNSYGPFEQASVMRGREDFYMDMIAEPEAAGAVMRRCTDVIVRAQEMYLQRIGKDLDFFEIPGDDYGGMSDLMISPESFQQLCLPELARIAGMVKEFRGDLAIVFHSDGAIGSIIGDLAGIGIDVLNPLEPLEAMDWRAVKEEFGDRMSFMGGVDLKKAPPGTREDVIADVKRCIDTFGGGGGYILTSANHMQSDIPPENIVTMFGTARSYGTYGA